MKSEESQTLDQIDSYIDKSYKYGFVTDIETEKPAKGLSEKPIKFISKKKKEPEWMLNWRLKAFERWQKMEEPNWANISFPKIDYQKIYYYAAPKGFEKSFVDSNIGVLISSYL